jgi:hypothetical protein
MLRKSLACDGGCGREITWEVPRGGVSPTKSGMEHEARKRGWNAPDKLGRHWCQSCRKTAPPKPRRKPPVVIDPF